MAQLVISGTGNTAVVFTLPILTVATSNGPVPVSAASGQSWFGWFPYTAPTGTAGMMLDSRGPIVTAFSPNGNLPPTSPNIGATSSLPLSGFGPAVLPAYLPGIDPNWPNAPNYSLPNFGWEANSAAGSITITDSAGTSVYLFGPSNQALAYVAPSSYPSQTFTATPAGLGGQNWSIIVP